MSNNWGSVPSGAPPAMIPVSSSSPSAWNVLLPMGLTFGGSYYLGRNAPNAMQNALTTAGLAGAGSMLYHYFLAPPTTSYAASVAPLGTPTSALYGANSFTNAVPSAVGFRTVARPFDEDNEEDDDDEEEENNAFSRAATRN